jgi:hypothetical protein
MRDFDRDQLVQLKIIAANTSVFRSQVREGAGGGNGGAPPIPPREPVGARPSNVIHIHQITVHTRDATTAGRDVVDSIERAMVGRYTHGRRVLGDTSIIGGS